MVTINLLPVKHIQKVQKARTEVIGFAASVLLVFVAIGLAAAVQIFMIKDLNAAIKGLQKEKSSYQSTINEIEKLKKDKAMLETKLAMIKKLRRGSHITVRLLDEIASLIPVNRLWLKSLKQNPSSLQLSGVALDNETIAQFMQSLKSSQLLTSAELGNSSLTMVADRKLKSFDLSCDVASVKTDQPEEKGKAK